MLTNIFNKDFIKTFYGAKRNHIGTNTQSIGHTTETVVTLANTANYSNEYDIGGWWNSANPERFTVPVGFNYVRIYGQIVWAIDSTLLYTRASLFKNGAAFANRPADIWTFNSTTGTSPVNNLASAPIPVVAGDYFTLTGFQRHSSSATLNIVGTSIEVNTRSYFAIEGWSI